MSGGEPLGRAKQTDAEQQAEFEDRCRRLAAELLFYHFELPCLEGGDSRRRVSGICGRLKTSLGDRPLDQIRQRIKPELSPSRCGVMGCCRQTGTMTCNQMIGFSPRAWEACAIQTGCCGRSFNLFATRNVWKQTFHRPKEGFCFTPFTGLQVGYCIYAWLNTQPDAAAPGILSGSVSTDSGNAETRSDLLRRQLGQKLENEAEPLQKTARSRSPLQETKTTW